jgi:hypothetical protein
LLQPEALFSMKGAKGSDPDGSISSFSINYLDVPVLLRYNVSAGEDASVTPYGVAGPNVAFKLGCSTEENGSSGECGDPKSLDLGVTVGAGIEFEVNGQALGVTLRYQKGLTDLFEGVNLKNKNIQILGTWRFR